MATKTWNGANADWYTAADWSPSGVPSSGDDVVISSGDPSLQSADPAATVASITLSGTLDVDSGGSNGGSSLTIDGALANTDALQIGPNNFILSAPTTLTLGGLTNSTGASLVLYGSAAHATDLAFSGSGTGFTSNSGIFELVYAAALTLNDSTFTNNGTFVLLDSAPLTVIGGFAIRDRLRETQMTTLTTLVRFNSATGEQRFGVADAVGDLSGTTSGGGAYCDGAVST